MTSNDVPIIRVSDPANLLSLVPYLLGFKPRRSLMVLGLRDDRVLSVSRLDLPGEPAHHDAIRAAMANLTGVLRRHRAGTTILIGYGPAAPVDVAVEIATAVIGAAGMIVQEALRVEGSSYYSLTCSDPVCCPPGGTPFDPDHTVAAVAATYAGMVAADDRDDVMARLAPIDGAARDAFADATAAAVHRLLERIEATAGRLGRNPDTSPATPLGRELAASGRAVLADAVGCYRQGTALPDEPAAQLSVLLALPSVRDGAVGSVTGEAWQLDMWSDLVRRAEPDFVAEPANLLTIAALLAGNGVLAASAVARALGADPDNTLSLLLRQVITVGISPDEVATVVAAAAEATR